MRDGTGVLVCFYLTCDLQRLLFSQICVNPSTEINIVCKKNAWHYKSSQTVPNRLVLLKVCLKIFSLGYKINTCYSLDT